MTAKLFITSAMFRPSEPNNTVHFRLRYDLLSYIRVMSKFSLFRNILQSLYFPLR